jgi:hypothetical protein
MFRTNVGHYLLQIWLDFWDDELGDYQSLHLLTLRADFQAGSILQESILPLKSVSHAVFCFNSTSSSSRVSSYTAASIAMWTWWWCSFRSCFSFVQSSEHISSVAQSKADFHAHKKIANAQKVLILHMSVCLSTSHSQLLYCRSFWANKTIFKVFQKFQFEQKKNKIPLLGNLFHVS